MKRPSFQFYPSDWLHDLNLRTCSLEARGLWIDLLCLMNQGEPYGTLKVNHKDILEVNLALILGVNQEGLRRLLDELEQAGVFSRDEGGGIYSRRMIRDETVRQARVEGGKKGGNPQLNGGRLTYKDNHKDNHKDNLDSKREVNHQGYPPPEDEDEEEDVCVDEGIGGIVRGGVGRDKPPSSDARACAGIHFDFLLEWGRSVAVQANRVQWVTKATVEWDRALKNRWVQDIEEAHRVFTYAGTYENSGFAWRTCLDSAKNLFALKDGKRKWWTLRDQTVVALSSKPKNAAKTLDSGITTEKIESEAVVYRDNEGNP